MISCISSKIAESDALRAASEEIKAGMKELDEGYPPHMLDLTEIVKQAWDEVSERAIARCWM